MISRLALSRLLPAPTVPESKVTLGGVGGYSTEYDFSTFLDPTAPRFRVFASEVTTLWQDTAKTVPVTEVGQLVAYVEDNSGGENDFWQPLEPCRPRLQFNSSSGYYFLEFDGIDDFLISVEAVDFSTTDEVTVVASMRKLRDTSTGCVVALTAAANNAAFILFAPASSGANKYNFRSFGTTGAAAGTPVIATPAAPVSNVVTGLGKISTDLCTLRLDGTQVATTATNQGTGNYAASYVYIGRAAGESLAAQLELYDLQVVGKLAATPELEAVEAYLSNFF